MLHSVFVIIFVLQTLSDSNANDSCELHARRKMLCVDRPCQSIYRISDYTRSFIKDESPTRL